MTYQKAGVDIDAGERLVERIRPFAEQTAIPEALGAIGGFAAMCRIPSDMHEPILVSGTDGVGTKLKIAFAADRHDTVGIDLVAMCVNDVITLGARPLFFLDYFASGKLDVDRATQVIQGISLGCRQAGCALLGGETAEMPDMYDEGEYDIAGFIVGVVEKDSILTGADIKAGDAVVGVASNGLHSNGFSLVRKVLLEKGGIGLQQHVEQLGEPLVNELLRPTRIYAKAVQKIVKTGAVKGLCHITGGGLVNNIPRILPEGLCVELDQRKWYCPPIFDLIAQVGDIEETEMRRTFNMGLGFVVIADAHLVDAVINALAETGETASEIGRVSEITEPGLETRVRFT